MIFSDAKPLSRMRMLSGLQIAPATATSYPLTGLPVFFACGYVSGIVWGKEG